MPGLAELNYLKHLNRLEIFYQQFQVSKLKVLRHPKMRQLANQYLMQKLLAKPAGQIAARI